MKININEHSATSAYGLVQGDPNFSDFLVVAMWGSWRFYSKYIVFVVVC